jgi:hypothetical protein
LGKVRSAIPKSKLSKDHPFFLKILQEEKLISDLGGHSSAAYVRNDPKIEDSYNSFKRFITPCPARHETWHKVAQEFKKIMQIYCRNSRILSAEEAFNGMVKTTTPGFPFDQYVADKGAIFEKEPDVVNKAWAELLSGQWRIVGRLRPKKEKLPREKVLDLLTRKLRTILGIDGVSILMGRMLCSDFNESFRNAGFKIGNAAGFTPYKLGIHKLAMHWSVHEHGYELDASNFDASMPYDFMQLMAETRWECLRNEDRTWDNRLRLKNFYHLLAVMPVVFDDGCVFLKLSGNPSGQNSTMDDNTAFMIFCMVYAWVRLTLRAAIEMFKWVRMGIIGDDNTGTISSEVYSMFNHKTIAAICLAELGVEFKSPDWESRPYYDLGFLSFRIAWCWSESLGYHVYGMLLYPEKILSTILQPKQQDDPDKTLQLLIAVRAATFNDPTLRSVIKKCIDLWLDAHPERIHLASWREIMQSNKSDSELDRLHFGGATERVRILDFAKSQCAVVTGRRQVPDNMSSTKRSSSAKGSAKPKVKFAPKASSSKGKQQQKPQRPRKQPRQQSQVMPLPKPAHLGASYNKFLKRMYNDQHGKWPSNAELSQDYPTYLRLLSAPVMGAGMLAEASDRTTRNIKAGRSAPDLAKSIAGPIEHKGTPRSKVPVQPAAHRYKHEETVRSHAEKDFAQGYNTRFKQRADGSAAPKSGYSKRTVPGTAAHKAIETIKQAEVGYKYSGPPNRSFSETSAHVKTSGVAPEMKEQHFGAAPAALYREIPRPHLSEVHSHSSGNSMTWTACERLTTQVLNTSFNTQGAQLLKLIGNPTMTQADRMKVGAQMFDNYEFTYVKLMWSSSCGVSEQGRILGAYDPDTSDASGFGEDALTKLASHEGASTTHVFNDHHWVMPNGCKRMCWTKYSAADDSDIRQTDQFNFFALVSATITGSTPTIPGGTGAPAEIGEWYVEYTIHYFNQTMESQLLGNGMITYAAASTNLTQTVSSNASTPRWTTTPTVGADYSEITASGLSTDVITGGPLSTSIAWRYASLTALADSPSGWFPCVPSTPFRVTVRAYWSDADAGTNRYFNFYVFNPDDPGSYGEWVTLLSGSAIEGVTVGYTNVRGELFPNMTDNETWSQGNNLHWVQVQETGITNAFSALASIVVDPSAFRYNASRVMLAVQVAGTTLTTAVLAELHYDVEALSVDLCSAYGVPALDPQGNLINNVRCVPTRNTLDVDMQRRATMHPSEFAQYQAAQLSRRRRRRRIRQGGIPEPPEPDDPDFGLGLEKRRYREPVKHHVVRGPAIIDVLGRREKALPPAESKGDSKAAPEEKKGATIPVTVLSAVGAEDTVLLDTISRDELEEVLDKRRRRLQSKPG